MKNIRSVDLNLLVVFDALFDERGVTRAAARLAVTQPTVSGLLKRLRRTFADPLFLRTSHGILPTRRAEALAGPIKDLIASAQSLVTPEVFDPATAETTIRIWKRLLAICRHKPTDRGHPNGCSENQGVGCAQAGCQYLGGSFRAR